MKDEIADYLKQCASSDYWPDGIIYDPEGDGSPIGSQGVFEHWDNAVDRQYSRNLGIGDGIELVYVTPEDWVGVNNVAIENILNIGPNPFSDYIVFSRTGELSSKAEIKLYNVSGQLVNQFNFKNSSEVLWYGKDQSGNMLANGVYIFKISDTGKNIQNSGKVVISR